MHFYLVAFQSSGADIIGGAFSINKLILIGVRQLSVYMADDKEILVLLKVDQALGERESDERSKEKTR